MYFCKDGLGIRMEILVGSKETTFWLADVGPNDSGNYSCVFSKPKYSLGEVTSVGQKSVFVHVKDFEDARIFIRNSSVSEGDTVDIKCAALESTTETFLHMYLCRNRLGVKKKVFEGSSGAHFTLRHIRGEGSGNYSCVYSKKTHTTDSVRCGNENSATLQVTENSSSSNRLTNVLPMFIPIPIVLLCVLGGTVVLCRKSNKKGE
ncbi:uncharacterized protein LOC134439920 [Engraulis encrasicolus]|uniref:uncharacterized protein LOC134439920 n=1 Tax=Engraulis encrasicolus TaxID=184585 RepID=UPI002FD47EFA